MDNSFIKMSRKITKWRWYTNANTFRVFFHLLITANFKDLDFEASTIKRGQVVISYSKLAQELNLTVQEVRTAISHLKSTNEISTQRGRNYLIVTINNYEKYQNSSDKAFNNLSTNFPQSEQKTPPKTPKSTIKQHSNNNHLTFKQQSINNQSTISKESKESKEGKEGVECSNARARENGDDNIAEEKLEKIGGLGKGLVLLSENQTEMLLDEMGLDGFNEYLSRLARFLEKGAIVHNHCDTMLKWYKQDAAVV